MQEARESLQALAPVTYSEVTQMNVENLVPLQLQERVRCQGRLRLPSNSRDTDILMIG